MSEASATFELDRMFRKDSFATQDERLLFRLAWQERGRADRAEAALADSSARALEDAASDLEFPDSGPYEVWASGAGSWLRGRAKNARERIV